MMTGNSANSANRRPDLLHTPAALWLWCLPILIVIVANSLYDGRQLSFTIAGVLLTGATLWIGAACYANGRHCGRLHCKIDGVLLPLLSLAGLLDLLRVTSFSWGAYVNTLAIIVVLSFAAEFLSNRLHGKGRRSSA